MAFRTLASSSNSAFRRAVTPSACGPCSSAAPKLLPRTQQRRDLHQLPERPPAVASGSSPFLPKRALESMWEEYQKGLLDRLNAEIKGTSLDHLDLTDVVLRSATEEGSEKAFQYASAALNNAFFLTRLRGSSQPQSSPDADPFEQSRSTSGGAEPEGVLLNILQNHFGSVTEFKSAFSAVAMGMSSSGYVWLVQDNMEKLGIVPTFGVGTLLVQGRERRDPPGLAQHASQLQRQPGDSSSPDAGNGPPGGASANAFNLGTIQGSTAAQQLGFDALRGAGDMTRVGQELYPLLCLSVHEHAWFGTYGVWGKEAYLTNFWKAVDWTQVAKTREVYLANKTKTASAFSSLSFRG